jgi:hypothetical protein
MHLGGGGGKDHEIPKKVSQHTRLSGESIAITLVSSYSVTRCNIYIGCNSVMRQKALHPSQKLLKRNLKNFGRAIIESNCEAGQPYHNMQCNARSFELCPNRLLLVESSIHWRMNLT